MTDIDHDHADDGVRAELGFADLEVSAPDGVVIPPSGPAATSPTRAPNGDATLSILVIEDDPSLRLALRKMLERAGFRVIEAEGGRVALTELRRGVHVDAMVTDLKMEDGSGGWLLAQIAYEYPALIARTVVISGDAAGPAAAHITTRWRCPVIAKPFVITDLVLAVARLARGGTEASEPPQLIRAGRR